MYKSISRRRLLSCGTLALGACSLGTTAYFSKKAEVQYLSAANDRKGNHFVLGLNQHAEIQFRISVSRRMHDACSIPQRHLAVFAERRPGSHFHIVDTERGVLIASIAAPEDHHFYGHSTYLASTDCLYVTENNYVTGQGIIGVYEAKPPFKRLGQFASGGVGPHQISHLNNSDHLVVANGGILTHPESKRRKLNIPNMAPNLSYLDPESGNLVDSIEPPHHQMSIRHIAISKADVVAIGIQDQAEALSRKNAVSLVLTHSQAHGQNRADSMLADRKSWLQLRQYIASVAYSDNGRWILTTSPKGHIASLWSAQSMSSVRHFPIKDAGGGAWDVQRGAFVVTNGLGELWAISPNTLKVNLIAKHPDLLWDNHLSRV